MIVKNIKSKHVELCGCGSKLNHWRKFSNQTATICRVKGCSNKNLVGASVQLNAVYDSTEYVVPLCEAHSNEFAPLDLVSGTKLVDIRREMTCEC